MIRRNVLTVNRILAAIVLVLAVCVNAHAQQQTPSVLLHSAQCLAAKKFLPASKAAMLSFGYVVDQKSYPSEKVAYIVLYSGSGRSHGTAFTVFLSEQQGKRVFDIQNNATFVRTKEDVIFTGTGEPLGGIWTHQHLVSAIKQIERRPRFDIPVRKLRLSAAVQCEAYTDR